MYTMYRPCVYVLIVAAAAAAAAAKSLQSCPTLCHPIDGSPPGSPVPGILQARTRVGCHFLLHCMKVKSENEVTQSCRTLRDPRDCSPPASSVHGILQARILEWAAMPPPGDLPHTRTKPMSPALQVDSLPSEPPGKSYVLYTHTQINTIYWTIKKAGE